MRLGNFSMTSLGEMRSLPVCAGNMEDLRCSKLAYDKIPAVAVDLTVFVAMSIGKQFIVNYV